jgi:serine/threonine protein kinase
VGEFELDLITGELRNNVKNVRLTEKPLRVLLLLVERNGVLVTREELQKRLWPNDTVVDFEHGINTATSNLRRALGDSANQPKYIETLGRRGYRLIAPVEWVTDERGWRDTGLQAAVLTGRTVSHYRVLEIIGGGGMGVVYRAEDLKLGRQVALKFLPEELGGDPLALERFSREARAASSLDHPNICHIYKFGEHEGQPFIVMQLLEGQTLRDRLARDEQALPLAELLDIGIQVSDGLQAAHEKGIIHRDIKPANIFLTSKGVVKILDFGLAKLVEAPETVRVERGPSTSSGQAFTPASADPLLLSSRARRSSAAADDRGVEGPAFGQSLENAGPSAPCRKQGVGEEGRHSAQDDSVGVEDASLTHTGRAMGTAGYMSPEQVRGEKLDARTDIFSLGLVLYEMASGQRAFSGETATVVHNAILDNPPVPVRELNSEVPVKLEGVIDKALHKDRELRYQSAVRMNLDLLAVQQPVEAAKSPKQRFPRRFVSLALIGLVIFLVGVLFRTKRGLHGSPKGLLERQLTANTPDNPVIAAKISPDGKRLAYTDRANGLTLLQIDTGEARSYPSATAFQLSDWTPDGDHVLLKKLREPGLWQMSVHDGAIRKVRDDATSALPSPDGTQSLIEKEDGLWVKRPDGVERKVLSNDSIWTNASWTWSPTGRRIAYLKWRQGSEWSQTERSPVTVNLETCDLAGGQCTTVLSEPKLYGEGALSELQWLPDGRILYGLREPPDTNVWALEVNPDTGLTRGKQQQLTNWTGISDYVPSASADGRRLILQRYQTRNFVRIAEQANGELRKLRPLNSDIWPSFASGWTRDSHTILITANRYGKQGIFVQSLNDRQPRALVSGPGNFDSPVASPDGKWLLYTEHPQNGPSQLMRIPLQGGPASVVVPGKFSYRCASAPSTLCLMAEVKGEQIVFSAFDPVIGRGPQLVAAKIQKGGYVYMQLWSLSPDGKNIAMVDGDRGEQVRILGTHGENTREVSLGSWDSLQAVSWSPDARHLYVSGLNPSFLEWGILDVSLAGQTKVLVRVPSDRAWVNLPIPSPDGRYLVYTEKTWESNVVMLENF